MRPGPLFCSQRLLANRRGAWGARGCTNPCGSRRVPGPSQPGWEPGRGPGPCTSPCLLLASGLEGRALAAGVRGVLREFSLSQARLPPAGGSPGTPFPAVLPWGLSYPGALCRDGVPVLLPSRPLPARAPSRAGLRLRPRLACSLCPALTPRACAPPGWHPLPLLPDVCPSCLGTMWCLGTDRGSWLGWLGSAMELCFRGGPGQRAR